MNTINQPSANPTNKLTAATLATSLVPIIGLVMKNLAPEWYDPEVIIGLTPVVTFVAGWFIKDSPNIVVVTQ